MAIDEILVLKGEGNVDVLVGGPGQQNWAYLSACAHMGGPSVPRGGKEIRWCQDPTRAGKFAISTTFTTNPDLIGGNMMTKLGKIDYLDGLDCPFALRARYAKCGERSDTSNYDPIMIVYCDVSITQHGYDDLVIADPANEDEILVTADWSAAYEYRIKALTGSRTGSLATLGDQPVNDIEYCSTATCGGACGARQDACSVIWGVTDKDTTPYAWPNLIAGVKNLSTGVITWTNLPIIGLNGNAENIECAGDRLIVTSSGASVVAYNDENGDQDEWNFVVLAHAPSANHNALFKRTPLELWLGAADGYVYKSTDKGASWAASMSGGLTAETINAVWFYDADTGYAVGNNGFMARTTNGGTSWLDITEIPTTGAVNMIEVVVPPGRSREVYAGTNSGMIYHSTDLGVTFAEYSFPGDGVGSVDDIDFGGPCGGDVMFILHNDGGPRGRVLRDLSGGYGGADVETAMGYIDLVAAGIDLNSLAVCGPNNAIVAGENYGGYPMVALID